MTWLETDVSASCETHCDTLGYGEGEAVPVRPPCHFASAFSLQRSCKHSRDKVTSNTLPSQSPHLKDRCLGPAAICKRPEEERSRPPPPHPPAPLAKQSSPAQARKEVDWRPSHRRLAAVHPILYCGGQTLVCPSVLQRRPPAGRLQEPW